MTKHHRRYISDLDIARAIHHNEALREAANPERDPDAGSAAFIASLIDDENETDETWEYMTDILEAGEIEQDEFKRQMRSVGYDDAEINTAISRATGEA